MISLLNDHIKLYEFLILWSFYIIIPILMILALFVGATAIICPIAWIMGWI